VDYHLPAHSANSMLRIPGTVTGSLFANSKTCGESQQARQLCEALLTKMVGMPNLRHYNGLLSRN
ncbi:MAG: hypothetical protein KDA42_15650, partial [Planctomycetales bacterium]|nr:hypothetical protein [Planctomycetales bacterium]